MGRPSVFVRHMNGDHEEARRIDELVPEVLRNKQAVVMWDIRSARSDTVSSLRHALSDHEVLSSKSLTVHDMQLPSRDDSVMRRFRVELNPERLERDMPALLSTIADFCTASVPYRDMMRWLDADWDEIIDRVSEAACRKRQKNGPAPHLEAISTTSEMAEVVFGKLMDRFVQEPCVADSFSMVKRRPTHKPIHDEHQLLSLFGGHRFRSTHRSPHSCTLYKEDHHAIEEYDAVMRVADNRLLAFDVTCAKNTQGKIAKDYQLPKHTDAEVAVVHFGNKKNVRCESGVYCIDLPMFNALREPSWIAFEQCRFGTKTDYIAGLESLGWGRS